jgi:site-specific recombinase XerD
LAALKEPIQWVSAQRQNTSERLRSFDELQLRQRMLDDMKIRNLALNTQDSYLRQVSQFARHFGRSPDLLGQEEIRSYQIHLIQEKKLAPGSVTIAVSALRFLYKVTLRFGATQLFP